MPLARAKFSRGVVPSRVDALQVRYEVRVAGEYEMTIAFSAAAGGGNLPGMPKQLTVHPARASVETTTLPEELMRGLDTVRNLYRALTDSASRHGACAG